MTTTAQLLQQRSTGHIKLVMGRDGPLVLREEGAAKVRLPRGSREAILINTGGGLAGGDAFNTEISCANDARLTVTSQAAERVYRSLGPPAILRHTIEVGKSAKFHWLPQETILFDGAALQRNYDVTLQNGASFLAMEPLVFGRTEMGETVNSLDVKDRWRITLDGMLTYADTLALGPTMPKSKATLHGAKAMATIIYLAADAEHRIDALRAVLPNHCGASAWRGKLIARVIAGDGFHLRKMLIPLLNALAGHNVLPKIWS